MAIINQINKFDIAARFKEYYLKGSNYIIYDISILHKDNEFIEVTPGQRINNWWQLSNTRLIKPIAMNVEFLNEYNLDEDTFEYSGTAFTVASGFIFGDFVKAKVPVFNPDNYNHTIVDIVASSYVAAFKGQFSKAYSCLRFAQVIMSLAMAKKRKDITESKPVHRSMRPFEL